MSMRKILLIALPAILLVGGVLIGTSIYLNKKPPAKHNISPIVMEREKVCQTASCSNHG